MRVVVGGSLLASGITNFEPGPPTESRIVVILTILDGLLFVAGLWTPFAGVLVLMIAAWNIFGRQANLCHTLLLSGIGAGLAIVGPGAWSLDARLFGWKRINLYD